jgi:alpha-ribazole phosphatase
MEIYLIRHTTPLVDRGICYGQTDLDVTDSFEAEASAIQPYIPLHIEAIHSSSLQRCSRLAATLFPSHTLHLHHALREIDCGDWEMKAWDDIPKHIATAWMSDFVNNPFPNGENYVQLYSRVTKLFSEICEAKKDAAIVTHGGVIRSILSYITNTALSDSFTAFKIYYGCVVQITITHPLTFQYNILHNIAPTEKETHKPSV